MTGPQKDYRLCWVTPGSGEVVLVGAYQLFEAALERRDEDVVDRLRAARGWHIRVDHVIIGPGVMGSRTVHPVSTALGVSPERDTPPCQADLDDATQWLAAIGRTSGWPSD